MNILVVGSGASFLFSLMIYALFAQILTSSVIGTLDDMFILYMIIFGLQAISTIFSIFVSIWLTERMSRATIFKASLMAYITNLLFIILLSYISLAIVHPEVYDNINGATIILIFPQIIVYFSIYILGHPIFLFILNTITYFIFFIIFIEVFYDIRRENRNYLKYNGW